MEKEANIIEIDSQLETPVAFFIFRRPEPTAEVFQAIRSARPKILFVIADGARSNVMGEIEAVLKTRSIVDEIDWPCRVHRIYAEKNLGLRSRLLTGLDAVFAKVEEAIILEDDCLPKQSFFQFCSQVLDRYRGDKRVGLISGFNLAPETKPVNDYFFSRSTYIWGWATWARTWNEFRSSPQVEKWSQQEIKEISSTFASRFQKKEFLGLLKISESLNTWDISLAVWVRQVGLLNVVPNHNFITNIGFGADATHTKFEAFDVQIAATELTSDLRHPLKVELDKGAEKKMWRRKFLRWLTFPLTHPISFLVRLASYLRNRSN